MEQIPPRPRRVFVLGRTATLDMESVVRRVVAEGAELVLVSVGYPVAPPQASLLGDALRLAGELRLWLDTVLVNSPREAAELIAPGDEVTILSSGRERRSIERALGTQGHQGHADLSTFQPNALQLASVDMRPRVHPVSPRRSVRTPASAAVSVIRSGAPVSSPEPTPHNEQMPVGDASEPDAWATESVEALAGHEVAQPELDTVWTKEDARTRKRASLRVYLGAAPGVGKTFAMLGEGQRRTARGTDVVIGAVQTYDRPKTIEMLRGLELVPPRSLEYRGTIFGEMDTDALIERRPEVALIDELAHTNIPGSRRAKRWEDVLDVLAAGISVITTVNVQHLTSLNDVVGKITGIRQQETVPDWVLDLADQTELVDMSPQALQRRMMHGNVYPDPRKSELALRRFFTMENLTALRELALMRVANKVDEELLTKWSKEEAPETRERILVCVSRPGIAEDLIRRGCRITHRAQGDLLVIHVVTGDRGPDPDWIADIQRLVQDVGGQFQIIEAEDAVEGVLSFAYQQHVTQILVGESLRSRWQSLLRGSFVNRLIERASNIDIHVIAQRER
jgi:hypothetical protein